MTDPRVMALLALESADHLDLITRAAPHVEQLRRASTMIRDWPEIEMALAAAAAAPEEYRAAFHQAIWTRLGSKYNIPAELCGALAGELRARKPQQPTRPPQERPSRPKQPRRTPFPEDYVADVKACHALLGKLPYTNSELVERFKGLGEEASARILGRLRGTWAIERMEQGLQPGSLTAKTARTVRVGLELLAQSA